ncbi:MAG: tetratricopeptide repeat protein [Dehalococcoidia bacterium]
MNTHQASQITNAIGGKYSHPYPFIVAWQGKKGFCLVRMADGSTTTSFSEAQEWIGATPGPIRTEAVTPDPYVPGMMDWAFFQLEVGLELLVGGYSDLAIDSLTKSIELDPHNPTPYDWRGVAYARQGQYDEAIRDYDCAIEICPTCASVYSNRGSSYCKKGLWDKALIDYNTGIYLCPGIADFYVNRGLLYYDMDEWGHAISDFSKAIELDSADSDTYNYRGEVYAELSEYEKALADFDHALALNPNDADAYANRALVIQLLQTGPQKD